ncbi:hypothetical protein BDZ89DRAFT_1153712 [Hymenopellis radicata]|nr:hypothetical protein BDZ89DRAFT_1153712 [Hymenopellis radicata]
MVNFNFNFFTFVLAVSVVQGAPVTKRIAQVIVDSTAKWEKACLAAGGALQCNPVSVTAFTTLLAAAGPCEQQDSADAMIDLAKTLNSDANMIKFAQIFAQQPRNTPTSQSVPYCGTAPKNAELNGLFQCQFAGADPTTFVGGLKVGDTGTIPFGLNAALDPAGSCKANPNGPIADGTQLSDLTQDPGVSGASGSSNNSGSGTVASSSSSSANNGAGAPSSATSSAASIAPSSSTGNSNSGSSSSFTLQNGLDAQKLNAQFASLTQSSSCQEGDTACINDGFAQCVGGAFVIATCGSGLTCAALPLVNKAGTSLTCTTVADATSRIAATGATGGITGDGSTSFASDASSTTADNAANTAAVVSPSSGGDFKTQNGQEAQKLNAQFAGLTTNSSCQDGENACVNGGFAQCVGGKFTITECNVGLQCFALPLVNSPGTSVNVHD